MGSYLKMLSGLECQLKHRGMTLWKGSQPKSSSAHPCFQHRPSKGMLGYCVSCKQDMLAHTRSWVFAGSLSLFRPKSFKVSLGQQSLEGLQTQHNLHLPAHFTTGLWSPPRPIGTINVSELNCASRHTPLVLLSFLLCLVMFFCTYLLTP